MSRSMPTPKPVGDRQRALPRSRRRGCRCRCRRRVVVVHDAHRHVQRRHEGRDRAVAATLHDAALAVEAEFGLDAEVLALADRRIAVDTVADQLPGLLLRQVFAVEDLVDVVRRIPRGRFRR